MNYRRALTLVFLVALVAATPAIACRGHSQPGRAALQARIYLPCNAPGVKVWLRVAPRHCTILTAGDSYATGSNLADLLWKHWGAQRATATGLERGFHRPLGRLRVTVVAFDLSEPGYCTGRFRVYRHVRVTSRYGTRVLATEGCTI